MLVHGKDVLDRRPVDEVPARGVSDRHARHERIAHRDEQVEHAVGREIKEETGMAVSHIKFNRTSFFEPSNTLMCNFTAFVKDDSVLSTNAEIDSYQWFTPNEARKNIRPNSLAESFLNAYLDE